MTDPAWDELDRELDAWAESGRAATLWWRDDDAVDATPALDRLQETAGDIPVGLAVIPAGATEALARRLATAPQFTVLQHGLRHRNHAPAGEKKAEFGPHRPVSEMAAELALGMDRLARLFGPRFLPVLVPPWNRYAPALRPSLAGIGFVGLSAFAGSGEDASRLDCHADPVAWRGDRGFIGTRRALEPLVAHLRRRRLGLAADAPTGLPTGLLTHHLAMDDATWAFCASLARRTALHTAVRWLAPEAASAWIRSP